MRIVFSLQHGDDAAPFVLGESVEVCLAVAFEQVLLHVGL
jgi:hypothetical protein